MAEEHLTGTTCAKLNLSLRVTGRRADGYHTLDSLVAFCEVGDRITVQPSERITWMQDGVFAGDIEQEENLVLKAARLLQRHAGVKQGAVLHLHKALPVASGIGGGSGDAALALQLLNQLWACGLSDATLAALGAELGADVPVCLHGRACRMTGIGEQITLLPPLPSLYAVLVNPLIPVATKSVFAQLGVPTKLPVMPEIHTPDDWFAALAAAQNDLCEPAMALCPDIVPLLETIREQPQIQYAGMSGSGATCYGIAQTLEAADAAAKQLRDMWPDYWVAAGTLR